MYELYRYQNARYKNKTLSIICGMSHIAVK